KGLDPCGVLQGDSKLIIRKRRGGLYSPAPPLLGCEFPPSCVPLMASDRRAVDHQLDAPVLLAAFGGVIARNRVVLAVALGRNGAAVDALRGQELADRVGPVFGELLVVIVGARAVGVAVDLDLQVGVGQQDAGNLGQLDFGSGLERGLVGLEQHVGHVHDEARGGVAGLQHRVELVEQLLALGLDLAAGIGGLPLGLGAGGVGVGTRFLGRGGMRGGGFTLRVGLGLGGFGIGGLALGRLRGGLGRGGAV